MIRDDISDRLVHLTRGVSVEAAAESFLSIFRESRLRGGNGCIKGGHNCVCFSEAPVGKLATILANPMAHGMRYSPFGVMVEKAWLYKQGGRPVIYQSDAEFELLAEDQRYRHVRYEPGEVDFTWEREWRIKTDELRLDPETSTLVVPTRAWEKWAVSEHANRVAAMSVVTWGWAPADPFPWHFVVLEDLGVPVPSTAPPGPARVTVSRTPN